MSTQPTSLNGSEAHDEQTKSVPATRHQKFPIGWGDLVGFRRRGSARPVQAAEVANGDACAVAAVPNGDGIVVVGKGASIVGEITNCTQVEIAGALEGKVVAEAVIVRAGGRLKGHVCSERAEVHGTIEGQVQVEDHLDIRSTGEVSGELAYGKLSVASGGRLAGSIQIVSEPEQHDVPAGPFEAVEQAEVASYGRSMAFRGESSVN
jgi:cytoskeletal protein CcmA (bactofilin family)